MDAISISDLARQYGIARAAVVAILDEHDVPARNVGLARCVSARHVRRVRPILAKVGEVQEARRKANQAMSA